MRDTWKCPWHLTLQGMSLVSVMNGSFARGTQLTCVYFLCSFLHLQFGNPHFPSTMAAVSPSHSWVSICAEQTIIMYFMLTRFTFICILSIKSSASSDYTRDIRRCCCAWFWIGLSSNLILKCFIFYYHFIVIYYCWLMAATVIGYTSITTSFCLFETNTQVVVCNYN